MTTNLINDQPTEHEKYEAPGNTREISPNLVEKWQRQISSFFSKGIEVAKCETNPPSDKAWFFNPLTEGTAGVHATNIRWNAFPKLLLENSETRLAAWEEADRTRNSQEEYCEWEVVRDSSSTTVDRVTFSTEIPEYYQFLFEEDANLLLNLYHEFVSPEVVLTDLHIDGRYNPQNRWNMPERQGNRGALMHMAFGPNTLGAVIRLAAAATWPSRGSDGKLITSERGLIDSRDYGARERHSDPHIGAQVNALTRQGNKISLAGPTGFYIDSVDFSGFDVPDGITPNDLMRVVRGDKNHMMRIVFEAPSGSNFKLGDVKIDGHQIRFGGQIAEKLTIRISAISRKAKSAPPSITSRHR